jgi:hypothetical protein
MAKDSTNAMNGKRVTPAPITKAEVGNGGEELRRATEKGFQNDVRMP